jgi:hypothetical protein
LPAKEDQRRFSLPYAAFLCVLGLTLFKTEWAAAQSVSSSQDEAHRRALELLSKMTVKEKADQLTDPARKKCNINDFCTSK